MRIGVISDTHIPRSAERLPEKIREDFANCDLILHAGDLIEQSVLDTLNTLAPTKAVCGNMDEPALQRILPKKEIITVGRFKIGLTHGYGAPLGLIDRVQKEFTEFMDVIVFGHSHNPCNEKRNGTLLFNPGSPTDKIFAKYRSYGILRINSSIRGEIIRL